MLYQVQGKRYGTDFCAGFAFSKGKVIMAAPIIKELVGKKSSEVKRICLEKGWKVYRA